MNIHESGEMYLETILVLQKESSCVRAIDVASKMDFSKASVSRALSLLKKDGYIEINNVTGAISLTNSGQKRAENIYEKHQILTNILMQIGIDEQTAVNDACRIEHVISDKTFEAIKKIKF